MYETYWQLESKPFETTADPRFYYPSESHQGAILKLRYAIENRRGAALLAGAAGLGKTLLMHTLVRQLPEPCGPIVRLLFPRMPADQLLAYLADRLSGAASESTPTIADSVRTIERTLFDNAAADRHAVVVLDEAQLACDPDALETIRLLLNFEHEGRPALTVLLSGQPPLLSALDRLPELDERMSVKCLLRRFTPDETAAYVSHRLNAAGARRPIFDATAYDTIHELSQGVARRINRLCDLALLIGFAEERALLGPAQIEAVAEELVSVVPE